MCRCRVSRKLGVRHVLSKPVSTGGRERQNVAFPLPISLDSFWLALARRFGGSCREVRSLQFPGFPQFFFHSPPWRPASVEVRQLQGMVRCLDGIKRMIVQEKNRLETVPPQMVDLIQDHISYLQKQVSTLQKLVRRHLKQHPRLAHQQELLTSIPGIGETTEAVILA